MDEIIVGFVAVDITPVMNSHGSWVIPSVCLPEKISPAFCGLRWMWWTGGEYDYSIFGGVDHGMMDISWFLGSVEEVGFGKKNP